MNRIRAAAMLGLIASQILAGCAVVPPSRDDLVPQRFPPTTGWEYYELDEGPVVERARLSERLQGLTAADTGLQSAADTWRELLMAGLLPSTSTVALGFASVETVKADAFDPFLVAPGAPPSGMALTQLCVSEAGCSACRDVTLPNPGQAPEPKANEFSGICATISTAYSLVYSLGKRDQIGPNAVVVGSADKLKWRKSFLQQIKTAQRHAEGGTPWNDIPRAYQDHGCACDPWKDLSGSQTAAAWLAALKQRVDAGDDCHLGLIGPRSAHDVHVDAVENGRIQVADTGRQGSGSGDDVFVQRGHQEWSVSGTGTATRVRCESTPGATSDFWNSRGYNRVRYLCCRCKTPDDGG